MLTTRKKAVMGIGTLIIFISVILVAAVAAGVIISTAGLLQQKSLIVGEEARKRLVNQLEVISLLADGNITAESVNNYVATVRLGPGSNPIQIRTLGLSFLTQDYETSMVLQHHAMDNDTHNVFTSQATQSLVAGPGNVGAARLTIDDRDLDGTNDVIFLDNTTSSFSIFVQLSNNNNPVNSTAILDLNFSAATAKYINKEALIEYNEVGYGHVSVSGYVNVSNISSTYASIVILDSSSVCEFTNVARETRFCYNAKLGNNDTVLDSGEVMEYKFRTTSAHELTTDDQFELVFYPDKGSLTRINRRTPDVITTQKIFLFP